MKWTSRFDPFSALTFASSASSRSWYPASGGGSNGSAGFTTRPSKIASCCAKRSAAETGIAVASTQVQARPSPGDAVQITSTMALVNARRHDVRMGPMGFRERASAPPHGPDRRLLAGARDRAVAKLRAFRQAVPPAARNLACFADCAQPLRHGARSARGAATRLAILAAVCGHGVCVSPDRTRVRVWRKPWTLKSSSPP